MSRPSSSSDNVSPLAARLEMLSTKASDSTPTTHGHGDSYAYDLYLMERMCCEAEDNDEDASHRLEAAYLSCLRDSLFQDPPQPIGSKRDRSPIWLPRSSTTTPTSVAMMDGSMLMSRKERGSPSTRNDEDEDKTTPELNAWTKNL